MARFYSGYWRNTEAYGQLAPEELLLVAIYLRAVADLRSGRHTHYAAEFVQLLQDVLQSQPLDRREREKRNMRAEHQAKRKRTSPDLAE